MDETFLTNVTNKNLYGALVLGGGGSMGIGWETGYLAGLADNGIDLRSASLIIGTSAGSQVGASLASGISWDDIWERLIESTNKPFEESPIGNMGWLFEAYDEIATNSNTAEEWIQRIGNLAVKSNTLPESSQLARINDRLGDLAWGKALKIAAVDLSTSRRIVWGRNSGVDLVHAVSSSSSLAGVWPPITIGSSQYIDGGTHSMENADVAVGADRVLILSVGLPIKTPFTLEYQINHLKESGSKVELITPSKEAFAAFKQLGGNPVDPRIRPVIAAYGREQGRTDANKIALFWNKD
ncbi:phospholipase, patatin family [Clostridiales bacterium oral taxon 876 str. F0540]|nr:phospholipase, patatin family [Clostridiales bacterium oral taxon 876 str. F0540]